MIGGSINGDGTITVQVTGTGESGYLAQVMKLVGDAQKEKSKAENLSDKVARALFYVALGVGILAFIVWFGLTGSLNVALERLVTVLIIACPHALGAGDSAGRGALDFSGCQSWPFDPESPCG